MRRGLSKTFRSHLVAFDTNLGVRYATTPTFWVRMYLIWTFRNFRSLPKQVFNRHQQKLIDELIRSSTISPGTRVDRSSLIGTVEQVRLPPTEVSKREPNGGTAGNVLAHESARFIVGNRGEQQAPSKPANSQTRESLAPAISARNLSTRNIATNKKTASFLLLAAAVLIVVHLLRSGIHIPVTANHIRTASTTLPKPVSKQAPIQNIGAAAAALRAGEQLSHATDKTQRLPPIQLTTSSNPPSASQSSTGPTSLGISSAQQGQIALASMLSPTPAPHLAASVDNSKPEASDADRTLPRLTGPPQSHMVYPAYPGTEQNGKVVLTAVVGQDGTVKSISVISGNKIFANAALKAVKQWRYLPYELEGRTVEFQTTIGFDFRGDEVVSVSFPQL